MNRKTTIVFSAVFLAISLILPIYVLTESATEDTRQLNQFLQENPLPADDTAVQQFISDTQGRHQTLFAILIAVELIFVILFAAALWLSLKP
jgi:hypothetical protein